MLEGGGSDGPVSWHQTPLSPPGSEGGIDGLDKCTSGEDSPNREKVASLHSTLNAQLGQLNCLTLQGMRR